MQILTYKYRCASCNHLFSAKEADCEDWRVPEKSFKCPKCSAYLAEPSEPRQKKVLWLWLVLIPAFALGFYYKTKVFAFLAVGVILIGQLWAHKDLVNLEQATTQIYPE